MKNILLSTAYFPPISYIKHILNADKIRLETQETFPKQTFRNRCEIATASGRFPLIVPVSKPSGNHTKTSDILISYRENWQQKHWRSITTAYSSSPFFIYYEHMIEDMFEQRPPTLLEFNHMTLHNLLIILEIHAFTEYTRSYEKISDGWLDLRKAVSPKKMNESRNIPRYPQVFESQNGFLSDLSILDLLFNLGPSSLEYLNSWEKS